jgi:hypothetical protein
MPTGLPDATWSRVAAAALSKRGGYIRGYALGAIDRVAMTDKVIAEWFEGLTAGDVMTV